MSHRATAYDRLGYLAANAFELFLCALTLVAVIQFFLAPDTLYESTVGRAVHPFDYAWLATYGVGSALACLGLALPSPRLEVAGLLAYASGVAVNLVCLIALIGNQSIVAILTYFALIVAALVRAHYVFEVTRDRG